MTEMVERVAKAIDGTPRRGDNWNAIARAQARAAIEAMREPSEGMLAAYMARYPMAEIPSGQVAMDWQAMITEALK
jgi:hypothetical protein